MGRKKTEHKATYGEIALEKGFITRKKLHECKKESGAHGTSIEKLLTDKGYLTPKQAEIVRNSQDSRIQDTMQSDRDIGKESGEIQKTQQQDSLEIAQSKYLKKSDSKKSVKEAESSLVLEEDSAVSGSSFFGDIAVEMGFANTEQIEKCSQEQAKRMQEGKNLRLGEVCVDMGVLKPEQVDEILRLQKTSAVTCQQCGASYDPRKLPKGKKWRCRKCNSIIKVPSGPAEGTESEEIAVERARERRKLYKKTDRMTGERTFGDYMLMGKIAQGGMGIIYKAKQKTLKRIVALKVLIAGDQAQQDVIDRFSREGEVVARLKHTNIVPVYDMGVLGGRHFLAMDFIHGESLRSILSSQKVPVLRVLEWTKKIASALDYAHENGVVHRDVKPENVLIDETGEPQVTDFGLAMDVELGSNLTRAGLIMGTPAYMSPEQVRGDKSLIDRRADIYALGAVMYEMLTGRQILDFDKGGGLSQLLRMVHEDPVAPRKINRRIPGEVETICLKAVEKDPDRRYQTAKEFEEDIHRFLAGEPIKARPTTLTYRAWKKIKKHKAVTAAVISAVLFAAITTAYFVRIQMRQQEQIANQVRGFLAEAGNALKIEHYDRAAELYTKVLGLRGDNVDAKVGIQRAKDGQRKHAEMELTRQRKENAREIAEEALTQLFLANEFLENAQTRPEGKRLLYDTIGLFDRALMLHAENETARRGKYESAVALGNVSMEDKDFSVAILMYSIAGALGLKDREAADLLSRAREVRRKVEEFDQLVSDAERKAADKEWDAAILLYELALRSDAVTPELDKELGQKIIDLKYAKLLRFADEKLAKAEYSSALEALIEVKNLKATGEVEDRLDRIRYLTYMEKGNTAREQAKLLEAIAHYEAARRHAKDKEEVERAIFACRENGYNDSLKEARVLSGQKKWREAIDAIEEALAFRKADPEADRLKAEFSFVLTCPADMTYVLSGEYLAGSEEPDDHNPKRAVKVGMFFIDKYEVTNARFRDFIENGGYSNGKWWDAEGFKLVRQFVDRSGKPGPATWEQGTFALGKDEYPVVGISRFEAAAYARWAGKRLPTTLEWEIAASWNPEANAKSVYPWGDTWNIEAGNFDDTESARVGSHKHDKSALGCFDMGGNAFEWTASPLQEGYYIIQSGTFGLSENSMKRFARTSKRKSMKKTLRHATIGFRCAMTPGLPARAEKE